MLCSVVTTLPKLSVVLKASKHSKISRTGLELGHLKVKECSMEQNPCKNQEKILHTQPSSILEVLNFLFHQMFSRRSGKSGLQLSQTLIAHRTKHSVMLRTAVKMLLQNFNQLDSR